MKDIKYFWGRKNQRTTYRLYKRVLSNREYKLYDWWRMDIKKGEFKGWNTCILPPADLKEATEKEAFIELL